jgi:hypothetical protein
MVWFILFTFVLAFAGGIWWGVGAPGWPHPKETATPRSRRLDKRPLNPIAWGKQARPSRRR